MPSVEPDLTAANGTPTRYQPLTRIATVVAGALVVSLLLDLVAVVSDLAQYNLLDKIARGELVTSEDANASDHRQAVIGVVQFVVLIPVAVVFIRWFHRAYKNLPKLGAHGLRYRPGWAIGAWFVPVLNLFRTPRIAQDIWRASDPELPQAEGESWKERQVPWFLNAWWGVWIVTGVVGLTVSRMNAAANDASDLKRAAAVQALADALGVIAAILAIIVVRRTTGRQEERARRVL